MSGSKQKRDRDPWGEGGGKDHRVLGIMCTVCGQEFRGRISEASRICLGHARREHPEEGFEYAAIIEPLTYEAEKKMGHMPTSEELMRQSEINRDRPLIRLGDLEEAQRLRRLARGEDGVRHDREIS